jgi:hypothetical protein
VAPTVFPSLVVTFVRLIVMFAMAAPGVVVSPAGFEVALMCVFFATNHGPGRFGGISGLCRGDILGLRQRSGAEQDYEGTEHDGLAHVAVSWFSSRPPIRPATGRSIGRHR